MPDLENAAVSGLQFVVENGSAEERTKEIVVLATAFPYPPTNGYAMRVWAILRCLAAEGCRIHLICLGKVAVGELYRDAVAEVCHTVRIIEHANASLSGSLNILSRLRAFITGRPYSVVGSQSKEMKACLEERMDASRVDVIWVEETNLLGNLPSGLNIPLIVDHHNVEHLLLQRYVRHAESWMRGAYARIEAGIVRRWEVQACSRAAAVLACSRDDQSVFLKLGARVPVIVAPNVIDSRTYKLPSQDDGRTVLYSGGMDWYPNRDAVGHFASNIFPHLRSAVPNARFVVAGRSPAEDFRGKMQAICEVEFTGPVPDMRAEIAKASVCVVPLRMGSGTRLKILEAAASGKAIVSTRIGAEGLEFVPGEEILLADDPTEFAGAVARLLKDPALRRKIGNAARERVERNYDMNTLRAALRQALSHVNFNASGRRRAAPRESRA